MPFFKHTIIDDEKWIVYHIVERKQSKGNWDESPRTTPKKKYSEWYITNCYLQMQPLIPPNTVTNWTL